MKIIDVTYDGTESLTVRGPKTIVADANETILWNFIGIPIDCVPGILFDIVKDGNQSPFGPFVTLEQRHRYVIASGKSSQEVGIYKYTAAIGRAASDHAGHAGIVASTKGLSIGISPQVQVTLDSQALQLVVVPEKIQICAGMTVTWNFAGLLPLAETWLPWIKIYEAVPPSAQPKNHYFGPFTCMNFSKDKVIGSGNRGVEGTYKYIVQQVNAAHENLGKPIRISSPEPEIANEGEPPPTPPESTYRPD